MVADKEGRGGMDSGLPFTCKTHVPRLVVHSLGIS